jgi:hypothetical protein
LRWDIFKLLLAYIFYITLCGINCLTLAVPAFQLRHELEKPKAINKEARNTKIKSQKGYKELVKAGISVSAILTQAASDNTALHIVL